MKISSMGALDLWDRYASAAQLFWTRRAGIDARTLARRRLRALLRFAREASPFYRDFHRGIPGDAPLERLPSVARGELMARFDEWVTDPRIKLRDLRAFLADRRRIGEPFLGEYYAWASSGTSGVEGVYLHDRPAMAVYDALVAEPLTHEPWSGEALARSWAGGGRAALVAAIDGHFASVVSWERARRPLPWLDARCFSVLEPLPHLVAALNEFRPAFLASYPSVLALLADEAYAGRLRIEPALAWSGGEHLGDFTRAHIERAFGCRVMNEYGASECLAIAHGCPEGWLHVHADWAIVEPVERDGSPTPPGRTSHTSLLTNLANRVQPVIRYDLGDRVLASPTRCGCGSPLPALRVEGRTDDLLCLLARDGTLVRLPPLAISTVVEHAAPRCRFQVVQTGAARLALRFDAPRETNPPRAQAAAALRAWLATQSLANVRIEQDPGPPRLDARSGKMRCVVVERHPL